MALLLSFLMTVNAVFGSSNCFSENNLHLPTFIEGSGITRDQYRKIIKRFMREFAPDMESRGWRLEIPDLWDVSEVQAFASINGNSRQIVVMGGMARHPRMTEDGLTLVFCHELGHHLGGAPVALYQNGLSIEGQADYFATLKCARRMFSAEANWQFLSLTNWNVTPIMRAECETSFQEREQIAVCVRSLVASYTMGLVNAEIKNSPVQPKLTTPDKRIAATLNIGHTSPQCRLDTYVAGALCPVQVSLDLSDFDLDVGACSRWFGQKRGVRPLCWYDDKQNFIYPFELKIIDGNSSLQ